MDFISTRNRPEINATSIPNRLQTGPKSTRNLDQIEPRSTKDRPQIETRDRPQMNPKSGSNFAQIKPQKSAPNRSLNRSQIGPSSISDGSRNRVWAPPRTESLSGPFCAPSWGASWRTAAENLANMAPAWHPKWAHNGFLCRLGASWNRL